MRSTKRTLAGWGNFPREECRVLRPERRRDLAASLHVEEKGGLLPRGLGRSYGDAALNRDGTVILQEKLDRFLSFDETTGVLEVEGGVSLARIIETFLPRGWLLTTTPGTKYATVGGVIAVDAHGKNHHRDGSIANRLVDIQLMTPAGDTIVCSPERNADEFWATCGGMGLTGFILSARLRLERVESAYATVHYRKTRSLDDTLGVFSATDQRFRYSVCWLDAYARGASLGRSLMMLGELAPASDLRGRDAFRISTVKPRRIPFAPGRLLRPLFPLQNKIYYTLRKSQKDVLVGVDKYFYPLDGLENWNMMYGPSGFAQYQAVFPYESAREAIRESLELMQKARRVPTLAVLKTMGAQNNGMLSFPRPGITLAADLPWVDADLKTLLRSLTELTLRHGGRIYLAKDAALEPLAFHAMYPEAARFRAIQRKLDPAGRFRSSLSRRIGLLED